MSYFKVCIPELILAIYHTDRHAASTCTSFSQINWCLIKVWSVTKALALPKDKGMDVGVRFYGG